jgi:leader peptidase (prepilin peptidase)/N-methyltransferase
VVLTVADVREHRLPNRVVASMTASTTATVILVGLFSPDVRRLVPIALLVAVVVAVLGITVAWLAPDLLGMGDAKLAPVVTLMAVVCGPMVAIATLLGVALLGGVAGAVVLLLRRDVRARFAYGPVLLCAPFVGLLGAPVVETVLGM